MHQTTRISKREIARKLAVGAAVQVCVDPSDIIACVERQDEIWIVHHSAPMTEEEESTPYSDTAVLFLPENTDMSDEQEERSWVCLGFIGVGDDSVAVLASHWLDDDGEES